MSFRTGGGTERVERYHPDVNVEADPRFLRGVELYNDREFFEAADEFEELFFEASGSELPFIRFFLQLSVGSHHAQFRQWRAAVLRLQEGRRVLPEITDHRACNLAELGRAIDAMIAAVESSAPIAWPMIKSTC